MSNTHHYTIQNMLICHNTWLSIECKRINWNKEDIFFWKWTPLPLENNADMNGGNGVLFYGLNSAVWLRQVTPQSKNNVMDGELSKVDHVTVEVTSFLLRSGPAIDRKVDGRIKCMSIIMWAVVLSYQVHNLHIQSNLCACYERPPDVSSHWKSFSPPITK